MTRTEKLLYTLIFIIISFIVFLFIQNFNKISNNMEEFISNMKEPKINIPNDKTIYNRKYTYKTVHETDNFIPKNIDDLKNIYYTILNKGWDEFTFYCDKEYESCADDVRNIANDSEYINLINNTDNIFCVILIMILLSVVGQCGDLFFSAIKREKYRKDFSKLIPGHGGILDRLDSIIFVLFAFILIMNFI